jgi:flagellar motor component MotA
MKTSQHRTISVSRIVGWTGAAGLVGVTIAVSGGAAFFNLPAAMFTFGTTFFLLLATFPNSFFRFLPDSLLTLFTLRPRSNPEFADIARLGSRYVIGSGIVGSVTGLVQMLQTLEDPSGLGAAMAICVLTVLYAVIASEFFFAFLYKAYSNGDTSENGHPLPLANLAVLVFGTGTLFAACSIMMYSLNHAA